MVSDRFRNRHLYTPLGADGRPRQHPQQLFCVACGGIFARRVKTNLPMCLRRCESSSLGRFAERVGSWLNFLPLPKCRAKRPLLLPFPAERKRKGPRGLSAVQFFFRCQGNQKSTRNGEILRNGVDETISLFRQAGYPTVFYRRALFCAFTCCFPVGAPQGPHKTLRLQHPAIRPPLPAGKWGFPQSPLPFGRASISMG